MVIDCDRYRATKPLIEHATYGKSKEEAFGMINFLSPASMLHVAVTCCYIGEIFGFNEALYDHIYAVMDFYKIDGIDNVLSKEGYKYGIRR